MKITSRGLIALFYCQRYGFLTVEQLASIEEVSLSTARTVFNSLGSYVASMGNVGLVGRGKAPKIYYITRKGYEALKKDNSFPSELLGRFRENKSVAKWTAKTFHRLETVDALLSVERSALQHESFDIAKTFIEYRRERHNNVYIPETTDTFNGKSITPDGAFITENEQGERLLFLLEIDRGTERITTKVAGLKAYSLSQKMITYEEYLTSGEYQKKYKKYGDFNYFQMLFITTSDTRVLNIKNSLKLNLELEEYFYLSTLEVVKSHNFFSNIWQRRNINDNKKYNLTRS